MEFRQCTLVCSVIALSTNILMCKIPQSANCEVIDKRNTQLIASLDLMRSPIGCAFLISCTNNVHTDIPEPDYHFDIN